MAEAAKRKVRKAGSAVGDRTESVKPARSRAARKAPPAAPAERSPEPLLSSGAEAPPNEVVARRYLVGIGASAGGLEALSALIGRLRPGLDVSYVVIQHLSPSYKSMLPQLLARETNLAVVEIESGVEPRPDTIYITPPNRNVVLKNGCLLLEQSPRNAVPKPSVNLFLTSLAEERREDAVGVILSGTGSDGAGGIRAIKASGGFTFAQEPASAKYDGMPQMAIATGCVDWILTPDAIADELALLCQARPVLPAGVAGDKREAPQAALKRLLGKVRARTKLDFSGYKDTTLWRRIERRMLANRTLTLEDYLEYVDASPDELERLAKDVLISVTSFFRDREAFGALEEVLRKVVARKQTGDEIRVWVAGCATGEEAYSIAILFHKLLGPRFDHFRIQIFATDVDLDAMQVARRGSYAAATLSDIDPAEVRQYFHPLEDRYEISKAIRDLVIFARQDLVLDPPFLRLDLITCRNVLIYLQNTLQAKILSLFHYALQPDGYLFLGKSESVSQQDLLFVAEDKEARIFRRRGTLARRLPATTTFAPAGGGSELAALAPLPRGPSREHQVLKAASSFYLPSAVIINASMQVQHVLGDAGEYLQIASGRASLDFIGLLGKELRIEAQTLVHNAVQKSESAFGRWRLPRAGKPGVPMRLAVHPLAIDGAERLFLVAFEKQAAVVRDDPGRPAEGDDATRKELEDELIATREHLQTLVEELETSNEEMQALNEEVQAANEELQATNEELEAANEELQSTNEELLTINEELQVKSAELGAANADLELIQNNVGMPILVVNAQGRLTRFNAAAEHLFHLHRGLVGETLDRLALPLRMEPFAEDVARALAGPQPVERHLRSETRDYMLRVSLNYAADRELAGAIVILVDQTEIMSASRSLRESEGRLRAVMDNSPLLVAIKDVSGRYEFVNDPYARFFGHAPEAFVGRTDEAMMPAGIARLLRDKELAMLRRREPVNSEECIELPGRTALWHTIRFPLTGDNGDVQAICTQAIDLTGFRAMQSLDWKVAETAGRP